jgi:hypothetical protein
MSVVGDIESFIGDVKATAVEVEEFIKKIPKVIAYVWAQIAAAARDLLGAWSWVVHGVEWIGNRLEYLGEETWGTLWEMLEHTIPEGLEWLYNHSVGYAVEGIHEVAVDTAKFIHEVYDDAKKAVHEVLGKLDAAIKGAYHWVEHAVWWVEHRAEWVWHLLTHPEQLAEMLAEHLVWPLLRWMLKGGSSVIVWLLKDAASKGSEVDHLFEDVLHDLL